MPDPDTSGWTFDVLSARIDKTEGRSGGFTTGWAFLTTGIALLSAVVAIYLAVRNA